MKNKKVLFAIVIILAILIFIIVRKIDSRYKVNIEKIDNKDAKYFLLEKDSKYGVIDKDGKIVLEPNYAKVDIPDPRKEIFICSGSSNGSSLSRALNGKGENLYSEYDSVEAIEIESVSSNIPYEKSVLKYKSGNSYGLISINGKKITDAKYEEISTVSFKEGYLKVKKDGAYGVITIKGVKLIDTDYDEITSDGYYNESTLYSKAGFVLRTRTDEGYRYGYANEKGKIILDHNYSEIKRINNIDDNKNIYLVTVVKGRYGLLKNKKKVLENEYDSIEFNEKNKFLILSKNGVKGVYGLDGKSIIPIDYDNIVVGGEYVSAYKSGNSIIFDKTGKKLDTEFTSYNKLDNDKAIVITEDGKYNIVDNQNNVLLSDGYIYIEYFKDDLYIASRNEKVGVINSNGNTVVGFEYETIQKAEGTNVLIAQKLQTNEINIVTKDGKLVKGLKEAKYLVGDKYIKVFSEQEQKYYTLDGEETTFQKLYPDNGVYADSRDGKWGAVDSKGNVIIKYEYDLVTEVNNFEIGVKKDGKWGVYSKEGKIKVDPSYTINYNDVEFLGDYYKVPNGSKSIPVYSATKQ